MKNLTINWDPLLSLCYFLCFISAVLWANVLTSLVDNVRTIVVVIPVALLMGVRSRTDSEFYGRSDSLLVRATFSSLYQFSLCSYRNYANNCLCVRQEPACNFNREGDSCSLIWKVCWKWYLDQACLVRRLLLC